MASRAVTPPSSPTRWSGSRARRSRHYASRQAPTRSPPSSRRPTTSWPRPTPTVSCPLHLLLRRRELRRKTLPRTWVNNSRQLLWVASQRSIILGRKGRTSGDDTMDEKAGHATTTAAWNSGDAYEPYVGRWSRLVAREFLEWLAVAPGGRWLDIGCGTGALAETILALAAPSEVVGIDPSPAYVAFARDRVNDARVGFEVGDAQALQAASATFDAVVSGLVLNFVPEPDKA